MSTNDAVALRDIYIYRLAPAGWGTGSYNLPMRLEIALALERASGPLGHWVSPHDVAANMGSRGLVPRQNPQFVAGYLKRMDCAEHDDSKPRRWRFRGLRP